MDELTRRGIESFNAGRFDEALERFRAAVAGGAAGPDTRALIAHVLASSGREAEAVAEFSALIAASPAHLPAYDGLAGLLLRRGVSLDDAAALRRAAAVKPVGRGQKRRLARTLRLCAQVWRVGGDFVAAEKFLRRATRLEPGNKESRKSLLEILRLSADPATWLERLKAEESALRRRLRAAPRDAKLRRSLAGLLCRRGAGAAAAGDDQTAEKTLREALALEPGDAATRRLLGRALRGRSRAVPADDALGVAAEKALRKALEVEPGNKESVRRLAEVLHRRGLALLAAGRLPEAEKALRRALDLRPRDKSARRQLLEVMNLRGRAPSDDLDLAEKALRRALAFEPRDPETRRLLLDVLRRRAQPLLVAGKFREAEAALRKALAFEPANKETLGRLVEALRLRARAYQSAGKRREARELSRRIQTLAPRDARARLGQGEVLFISGRFAQGRAQLARALRLDRGDLAPDERYRALMKLGRHAEAVAVAEKILDGKPGLDAIRAFWDPWEWDERLPRERRRAELDAMEKALGSDPSTPWLHYYRGDLAGPEGVAAGERIAEHDPARYGWMFSKAASAALWGRKFQKAADWFEICLRHEPVDWRTRAFLAETYLCLHRPDAAYAEMDRALKAAPDNETGQVLAWRGAFDLWLGRYEEALVHLQEAARLGAQCALCWIGAAQLKLGRDAQALKTLDEALRLYPLDFEAIVWRGEAKRRLGRHREALKDLSAITLKDPTRPVWLWALFNRALVKRALGDLDGMAADFSAILPAAVDYVRAAKGLPLSPAPTPDEMSAILEAGLELAKGFRREEYGQAIWML